MDILNALRAGDQFKRFFVHAIRNGKNEVEAADEALTKSRRVMADLLDGDKTKTEQERLEEGAIIIQFLMAQHLYMKDLYVDRQKLEDTAATQNKNQIEKSLKEIPEAARVESGTKTNT